MTFEERKRIAAELLVDFLGDFAAPRGLDDQQMARRITSTADAFARRMPIGDGYEEKIEMVLQKLRDTHQSNSWPPQAAFVEMMPRMETRGAAPATFRPDAGDWIAKRMSVGDPVPETQLWKNIDVDPETLDRYRFAAAENWRSVYGSDAEKMMVARYGSFVRRYFV